jgi:DNA-binding transcriptional LysR family regulator
VNYQTLLSRIDLNLFVVFDTIYAERNLTRAAERLSLTQPAVSNALARLRRSLDDPLFVKTRSGMEPTALAESIAEPIAEALQLMQGVSSRNRVFDPACSKRSFRLSLLDLHAEMILPRLLQRLRSVAPGVGLDIQRTARADLSRALSQGTVEIASDIPLADTGNLVAQVALRDPYVCALRPDHPLANEPLTLERYLSLTHIHVSSRPKGAGAVDLALRKSGTRRKIGLRTHSYLAVGDMVRNSDMGVTLTRSWALAQGLTTLPLPLTVAPMEIRLYRHLRSDGDAAILWLFDLIADALDH